MNDLLGMNVKFVPFCIMKQSQGRPTDELPPPVFGRIVSVHWDHGWFRARWYAGKTIQHECFKFSEIGKVVELIGRKKNVHAKDH